MIDPRGMDVISWSDAVILDIDTPYAFGRLDKPENWREWGVKFCAAPQFAARNPPSPYGFEKWDEWAMRIALMLETVTEVV